MLKALVGSRHTKQMYACAVLHAHIHLHLVGNVKQISPQEIDVVPFFYFAVGNARFRMHAHLRAMQLRGIHYYAIMRSLTPPYPDSLSPTSNTQAIS